MKRLIYFLFLLIVFYSCQKEVFQDEAISKMELNATRSMGSEYEILGGLEEYMPGTPKELITNAYGVTFEKLDTVYILGDDALMSKEQAENFGRVSHARISCLTTERYLWPGGIVYFSFTNWLPGLTPYTKTEINRMFEVVVAAMNYYHDCTGIQFVLKRADDNSINDYIEFILGDGSWSYVGRQGGRQQLCLDPKWATEGTALHELGHAIGLLHEQSRVDRDKYINIMTDNIKPDKMHNFTRSTAPQRVSYTFDYNSIMLYGSYNTFAINLSKPTMTRKDGTTWDAQRSYLSMHDEDIIYYMYPYPISYRIIWPIFI